MSIRNGIDRKALIAGLDAAGADGWLLFDFRGLNPVAGRVLQIGGMGTRRLFVWIPREGEITAVAHKIELGPLQDFPGRVVPYARWQELHEALRAVVGGKTVAMEISPLDAVPYLDRVPFGVIDLLRSLGVTVVPSAPLVTQFAALWSPSEMAGHERAAEILANIARAELERVVQEGGSGISETAVQARVVDAIHAAGLEFDHPPIVGFGPSAADPHYEPLAGRDRTLEREQVVLLDLWAGPGLGTVFADQTWMGFTGRRAPEPVQRVWDTVRRARDAAVERVLSAAASGTPVRGYEVDDAARAVVESAGLGQYFVHRTGHSIDRDLHGSGPHIDDYETRDDRLLMPGVGFSVEPGIYFPGDFGVRSEVNMYWGAGGPVVTPSEPQRELITAR
jgi:Xaa-Pro aminopeptidase